MEFSPAQLQEPPTRPQGTTNNGVSLQELLSTIGELHVSNRRMLMQIDEMSQIITQLRTEIQTLSARVPGNYAVLAPEIKQ